MASSGRFAGDACLFGPRDVSSSRPGAKRSISGVIGRSGNGFFDRLVDSSDFGTGLYSAHGNEGGYGTTREFVSGRLGGRTLHYLETYAVWPFPKNQSTIFLEPKKQEATTQQIFVRQDFIMVFADNWIYIRNHWIVLFHTRYYSKLHIRGIGDGKWGEANLVRL